MRDPSHKKLGICYDIEIYVQAKISVEKVLVWRVLGEERLAPRKS